MQLSAREIASLQAVEQATPRDNGPYALEAPRRGLLFYSKKGGGAAKGISLWTDNRLTTYHFMVDVGSQIALINHHDSNSKQVVLRRERSYSADLLLI